MLEKQKALDGECRITTALFDNNYEILHDPHRHKSRQPYYGERVPGWRINGAS
jgi:hypothetical protein